MSADVSNGRTVGVGELLVKWQARGVLSTPVCIGYFGQLGLVSLSEESDARTLLLYLNSGDISQ